MNKRMLKVKTRAVFSTLDEDIIVHAMQLRSSQKQPNLNLKTRSKLILGYLPLAVVLPR